MNIDGTKIGGGSPTYLIAELGINHNGRVDECLKLIEAAKASGVSAVKLQVFQASEFLSKTSAYFEQFSKFSFNESEYCDIFDYAANLNITIFASVFDFLSLEMLQKLDCCAYKIASGDINHLSLIKEVAKTNKPIIFSRGGANLIECQRAIEEVRTQNPIAEIAILHCVSNYPLQPFEANLASINTLKKALDVPTGFSDHSIGLSLPIAAVALGAEIIEKHFTLDCNNEGFDHALSVDPKAMSQLSQSLKDVHEAIGSEKIRTVEDPEHIKNIRRGVRVKKNLVAGTKLSQDLLSFTRPQVEISADEIYEIIGKKLNTDLEENEVLQRSHLE